jgi:DNA repair protein RadC
VQIQGGAPSFSKNRSPQREDARNLGRARPSQERLDRPEGAVMPSSDSSEALPTLRSQLPEWRDECRCSEWVEALTSARDSARVRAHLDGLDLVRLSRLTVSELRRELGLGAVSARRLRAAFALGEALERARRPERVALRSPRAVFELLRGTARGLEQERFWSLLLDGKQRLRRVVTVSVGTLTASLVHPREVFRSAVREAAGALIVAHNHPSGDPEPSREDLAVTERLRAAGEVLGIPVQDHVILGERTFVSLRERRRL